MRLLALQIKKLLYVVVERGPKVLASRFVIHLRDMSRPYRSNIQRRDLIDLNNLS